MWNPSFSTWYQSHKGGGYVVLTPLMKKINCHFEDRFGGRSNGFNVELGTQLKNVFGGTNEVTYHSWVKDGVYSQHYFYSTVGYAVLLDRM
ncbi:hypothetical protein AMTRI_Chr11g151190 [Amborella trichopoda]